MTARAEHERLDAWQKAMQATVMSYAVARRLPVEERYELASQIRRAAVSIPANIAEACGRSSPKERLHFLAVAQGSNAELRTLHSASEMLGYVEAADLRPVRDTLE